MLFKVIIKRVLLLIGISIVALIILVWRDMKSDIEVPLLAVITNDSHPFVSSSLAMQFIKYSDLQAEQKTSLGMPLINYVTALYNVDPNFNNDLILELSQLLINKGATVDAYWSGLTPLQSSVLSQEIGVVRLLLFNNADTALKVSLQGEFYNMTALDMAIFMQSKGDMSEIISLLQNAE